MLRKIFFLALFLSLTFPRAGVYIHTLPITIANILLGGVFLAWLFKRIHNKSYPEGFLEWAGLVYLGYVFFVSFFGLIQGEKIRSIIGLIIFAGYAILFFVTLFFLKTKKDIVFVTNLIILGLVIVIGYGVLQVFLDIEVLSLPGLTELYGSPRPPVVIFKDGWYQVISGPALNKNIMLGGGGDPLIPIVVGHKIFSTFHHGNLFGLHLVTFIPLLLTLTLTFSLKKRIIFSAFSILAMVVLIFSNSRGAFFGFGVGMVSLIFFLSRTNWFRIFSLLVISILIFIFIVSLAVLYDYEITGVDPSVYLHYNFVPRYLDFSRQMALFWKTRIKMEYSRSEDFGLEIDDLSNQRFSLWREVLKAIFRDRTLKGILFGSSFCKMPYPKSHNFYFGMISEIGLIGFGLFLLFLGYIMATVFRALPYLTDEKLKAIAKGGLAGIIAALSHNLFDVPFYYPPLLANFWILIAVVAASVKR